MTAWYEDAVFCEVPVQAYRDGNHDGVGDFPGLTGKLDYLAELGLEAGSSYQVHDLITDARFLWHGEANYVLLDPSLCPAHILRLRRRVKTERDFDYYM